MAQATEKVVELPECMTSEYVLTDFKTSSHLKTLSISHFDIF